jgi:hypothetical protein
MPIATPITAAAATAEGGQPVSPSDDRRADHRMQTIFRVARVISAHDEGLARIRNLSDHGAGLSLSLPVSPSDTLMLELAEGVDLFGQVLWIDADRLGLEFERPIDCRGLLARLAAGAHTAGLRPVRLPIATTALTCSARGVRRAEVLDISQRGLKLVHDGSLTAGLDLKVTLPCGIDRHGIVRWTRAERAGVMLLEPLSVEALGSIRRLLHPPAISELWPQRARR